MNCLTSSTHSDAVDDALSSAKSSLAALQNAPDAITVPGLAPAISLLIALIERVQVRWLSVFVGLLITYFNSPS